MVVPLPVLYAIRLSHVKNVELVDDQVPTEPPFGKHRERLPDNRWKLLIIDPARKLLREGGAENTDLSARERLDLAAHICRGHIKEYGPGAPLFGKHVGEWFWRDHIRGNVAKGTVSKDYEIKPLKKESE
jgi:hypothetical protein